MNTENKFDLLPGLDSPAIKWFGRWQVVVRFFVFVYLRFFKDDLTRAAASLTFTSLLALVPLLSVCFAILGAFPAFETIENAFSDFIFNNLVPSSGETLEQHFSTFIQSTKKLSLMGAVFLVITALLTMETIERAFNAIWRVKRPRRGIAALMLYWAVLTMTPMLIGLSLAVSSYLTSLPFITETATSFGVQNRLLAFSSFILELTAFSLLYAAVPHCRVRVSHAIVGGLVAAILFEASKTIFAWYLQAFPTYQFLYGALAAIPIFMIWVYISWVIILLGAEVANALSYDHRTGGTYSNHQFVMAYYWLGHLWYAQKRGEGISLSDLLKVQGRDTKIEPDEIIYYLTKAKLVDQLDSGEYILTCDLNQVTLLHLYRAMPWKLPMIDELKINQDNPWSKTFLTVLEKIQSDVEEVFNTPLTENYKEEINLQDAIKAVEKQKRKKRRITCTRKTKPKCKKKRS